MGGRIEVRGARTLLTGATGGLGHAIAHMLRARGAELVLTGRRAEPLAALATEVGGRAIEADLAEPDAIDRLLSEAGDIDLLIANAALPSSGALLEYTPEQIHRAIAVNLEAPIQLARAIGARMVSQGRGHIVLVGSVAGVSASLKSSLYNATKFGLRGFALGFRQDVHAHGVGVSIVEPGFVRDAGMFADSGADLPRGVRTVSPDDVARGVVSAVERDRAEVIVAPAEMRLGLIVASLFPDIAATVQRRVGVDAMADSIVSGQAHKR